MIRITRNGIYLFLTHFISENQTDGRALLSQFLWSYSALDFMIFLKKPLNSGKKFGIIVYIKGCG